MRSLEDEKKEEFDDPRAFLSIISEELWDAVDADCTHVAYLATAGNLKSFNVETRGNGILELSLSKRAVLPWDAGDALVTFKRHFSGLAEIIVNAMTTDKRERGRVPYLLLDISIKMKQGKE